jgi:hypothetical protein
MNCALAVTRLASNVGCMKMILLFVLSALVFAGCCSPGHSAKCCSAGGTCTAAKSACCSDGK